MARFNTENYENYGGGNGGNTSFFSIPDDGGIARVRFMYNGIEDVEGFACHEVEVNDKKRYVNCLRDYGQPVDECPFCKAGRFQVAKVYVPIYDLDTQTVKIWERGKKFMGKLSSICSRYPNVVSHTFEIERHGKKGDTSTTYEIYETGSDDTKLEDLPEVPKILGGLIFDKSYEEMENYIKTGEFSSNGNSNSRESSEPIRRRTPANGRRDTF